MSYVDWYIAVFEQQKSFSGGNDIEEFLEFIFIDR